MGKIFWTTIIIILIGIFFIPDRLGYSQATKAFYYSECDSPIKYRVGTIDKKFGLSEIKLMNLINQSVQIWEKNSEYDLFVYDPKAELTISLVYDERQALNSQIGQLKDKLESKESEIKPEISQFEKRSADFKQNLEKLNEQIDYWNSKGGAPQEEFNKLSSQQEQLRKEAEDLNMMAKTLNQTASIYNTDVKKLNQTISAFNEALTEKPEEGLYDPVKNTIDIYFNISNDELVHTLAHELGHARGLEHNQDKFSIMYKSTSETLVLTKEDKNSLENVCQKLSLLDLATQRLALYINLINQNLNANF